MLRGSLYQLYMKASLVISIESNFKKKDTCSIMRIYIYEYMYFEKKKYR
jgi:hypothetical protein